MIRASSPAGRKSHDCKLLTNRYRPLVPDLLIRNLPVELHGRLKAAAAAHRRSVTQEAISTLERGLAAPEKQVRRQLPPPVTPKGPPISTETLQQWIDEGQR